MLKLYKKKNYKNEISFCAQKNIFLQTTWKLYRIHQIFSSHFDVYDLGNEGLQGKQLNLNLDLKCQHGLVDIRRQTKSAIYSLVCTNLF